MRVIGFWYGGASYSLPEWRDRELFQSVKHAKETFSDRYDMSRTTLPTFYVERDNESVLFPCVGEDAEMQLCSMDSTEFDEYHTHVLTIVNGVVKVKRL